jgi:hypothetical protein
MILYLCEATIGARCFFFSGVRRASVALRAVPCETPVYSAATLRQRCCLGLLVRSDPSGCAFLAVEASAALDTSTETSSEHTPPGTPQREKRHNVERRRCDGLFGGLV